MCRIQLCCRFSADIDELHILLNHILLSHLCLVSPASDTFTVLDGFMARFFFLSGWYQITILTSIINNELYSGIFKNVQRNFYAYCCNRWKSNGHQWRHMIFLNCFLGFFSGLMGQQKPCRFWVAWRMQMKMLNTMSAMEWIDNKTVAFLLAVSIAAGPWPWSLRQSIVRYSIVCHRFGRWSKLKSVLLEFVPLYPAFLLTTENFMGCCTPNYLLSFIHFLRKNKHRCDTKTAGTHCIDLVTF